MQSNVVEIIQKRYSELTGAQKSLATYVLNHFPEAALLKIEQLAAKAGVSPATVSRLATELGFKGFAAFQQAMQGALVARFFPGHRAGGLTTSDPGGPANPADTAREALFLARDLGEQLIQEFDSDALVRAAQIMVDARRRLVLGSRISMAAAYYLTHRVSLVLPSVQLLDGPNQNMAEQLLDVEVGDVLAVFSLGPVYCQRTLNIVRWARDLGLKVVAFTDSPVAPIANYAHEILLYPSQGYKFQFSLIPIAMLVDAFVNVVSTFVDNAEEVIAGRLEQVSALWKTLNH